MKKMKIWKIGTNIKTYIYEFFDWMEEYNLDENSYIYVRQNKKKNNVIFNFNENKDDFESLQKTKAQQILKILISLGIILPNSKESFLNDNEMLDSVKYVINSNKNNWRDNFILELKNFVFLDYITEDNKDANKFIYPMHKNSLYSILKSFEIKDSFSNDFSEYSKEEKKSLNYWIINELFNDYNIELREIASKLIHPIITPVKPLKDNNLIKWKIFKIKKLDNLENKEIESNLWNIFDILSKKQNISIPIMQRKYIWTIDLIEKLIEDISSLGKERSLHYIGSIVYKEKENNLRILDGQQRLTTLFLILSAISYVYTSDEAYKENIEVPLYIKELFEKYNSKHEYSNKSLRKRFIRVAGNQDYDDFFEILDQRKSNHLKKSIMWKNYNYIIEKISKLFKDSNKKQELLDLFFKNIMEGIVFTANKNQVENEYDIFEKLNTLSKPLTQIDLLKNYLLPFCEPEVLDFKEAIIQEWFEKYILTKFNNNEAIVKRFINYFVALYELQFLDSEERKNKSFKKLSLIISKKYNLEHSLLKDLNDFKELIKSFGDEISDFQSITDKSKYTNDTNKFHNYSDILFSFDKRYVYAPLIKTILNIKKYENLDSSKKDDRNKINEIRKILFELERYELLFQVVLYRGQSLPNIIEKIIISIKKEGENLSSNDMRKILSNPSIMSKNLTTPMLDSFIKKIKNEPIADKVSTLILNRLKFYFLNSKKIDLSTVFNYRFLKKPSREHIISQEVKDEKIRREIFKKSTTLTTLKDFNNDEFNKIHKTKIDMIGNILLVEQSDNSEFKNKPTMKKNDFYLKKNYLENDPVYCGIESIKNDSLSLKTYLELEELGFDQVMERSRKIADILEIIYK